jgi:4-hydroxybenzoyl-CoA thioesterase
MNFTRQIKVRFSDTDPAGVMYFPRFLDRFHAVFEDWFDEDLRMPYRWVLEDTRIGFPTVRSTIDYRGPFRFGQIIEVELAVTHVGRSSFSCNYKARLPGEDFIRVECDMITATVDLDSFEAIAIPEPLREKLMQRLGRATAGELRPAKTASGRSQAG